MSNHGDLKMGLSSSLGISSKEFTLGEVYLFHATDEKCPVEGALWGVFDKIDDHRLFLESSSVDLKHFLKWMPLPEEYRYYRLATREELRDYVVALTWSECLGGHE